jgi:hypothetical protein
LNLVGSNFEPLCSSSNKNTTTTTTAAQPNFDPLAALRWPASFDENLKRLVYRALSTELPDPAQHQDILDALAHQAADPRNPLRNPVGLTVSLCRRAREGRFHPVGPLPGAGPPGKHDGAGAVAPLRPNGEPGQLRGDIAALERLLEHTRTEETRQALEAQLERLRGQMAGTKGTPAAHTVSSAAPTSPHWAEGRAQLARLRERMAGRAGKEGC